MLHKSRVTAFICALLLTASTILPGGCAGINAHQKETDNNRNSYEEVSILAMTYNGNNTVKGIYSEEIIKKIEDYCGCRLSIDWVNSEETGEKAGIVLQSPDSMPMIITWGGEISADVVAAARNGQFVNVGEYIYDKEKYPNLSGLIEGIADNLTVDGNLIAIPRMRVVGRYGLCYRRDWAEKLGLSEPSTPEAVYDMLYAFTYNDPDGNGIDDTIGLEMTSYTGVFDIIQTWFGCGNGWADVDGKLVPVHMQKEYFEALDYIRKLYADGLMPADWAARSTDSWSNGCKVGQNGVFIDVMDSGRRIWDYFCAEATYTPSVTDQEKPAEMCLYGAVNNRTLATSGYNGFFTLSASTCNSPEKIEAALTFLDRLCDDEMLVLTQFGLEGVNYTIEDGYIVRMDSGNIELASNYAGLNQLLCYLPSAEHIPNPHVKDSERVEAQNAAYAKALEYAVVNPAAQYLINSEAYAEVGASLQSIIELARIRYICGEIDRAELEEANRQWLLSGGDRILKEVNKRYNK